MRPPDDRPASPPPLADEVWPYISLDNVMDSITLHSSNMFIDLAQSLRWNPAKACKLSQLSQDGQLVSLKALPGGEEATGQATVLGMREYNRTEVGHRYCFFFV